MATTPYVRADQLRPKFRAPDGTEVIAFIQDQLDVQGTLQDIADLVPAAPVTSVFGRTGAILAALNDYNASLINNDSGVAGATVAAALDALNAAIGDHSTTHEKGGSDEISGDLLDIDFVPSNYAPSASQLDAHLSGIDVALSAGGAPGGADKNVQFNNGGVFAGSGDFFFDTVTSTLGIGTSLPVALDGTMHVHTGSAGATGSTSSADDLTVENSADAGITILTPDANIAALNFGSPNRQTGAFLRWQNSTGIFNVGTGDTGAQLVFDTGFSLEAMRFAADGSAVIPASLIVGVAGTGIKMNSAGEPGSPVNGDIWVDAGDVIVRSGGQNRNVSSVVIGDVITTTDNTTTTIQTIAVPDDTVILVTLTINARRTDAADRAGYVRRFVVFREAAGAATLEGAVDSDFTRESDPTWDVVILESGNNILIQVNGDAGHTINWKSTHIEQDIS